VPGCFGDNLRYAHAIHIGVRLGEGLTRGFGFRRIPA
jgi:hypothetical protein